MDINNEQIDVTQLDPELKKQLDLLDQIDADKIKNLYSNTDNNFENPTETKKLISSPHEIIFTIMARVMEENLKGEIVGDKEISVQHYHIPVPIDKDYRSYVATFFKYLEDKLLDGISHANKNSEGKNEQNQE